MKTIKTIKVYKVIKTKIENKNRSILINSNVLTIFIVFRVVSGVFYYD